MARAYMNYGQPVASTPQSRPIPYREHEMTPNSAGGYGFVLDDWERLMRFLIIGSVGGTYYVSEQTLTAQNADVVIRCLKADGLRVVAMAAEVNINNRAPKVDSQLFALALAMKHGDVATKQAVGKVIQAVIRTGTHLLHFVAMLDNLGGWSRAKRRLIAGWFNGQRADRLAFQVLKYQTRDGWSMRDVLRVAHPVADSVRHNATFVWALGKMTPEHYMFMDLPEILAKYEHMKTCGESSLVKAIWGIENDLPREALPTEALNMPEIQARQLPTMPIGALLRNLGNLTASGVADQQTETIAAKLTDREALRRGRVHPFAILLATMVYKSGAGFRGSKTWMPNKTVLAALEDAYDAAFDYVTPTGKKLLIAIDVSGSMSSHACIGTPIKASEAAAAMAVTLARCEPHATVVTFDTRVQNTLHVTSRTGIASIGPFRGGGTDVASPVSWAESQGHRFDAVVLLTDNETWAGNRHSTQALASYRKTVGLPVKLICCSMAANHVSVVDPQDPLQFGAAGLDSNLPTLVADFISR